MITMAIQKEKTNDKTPTTFHELNKGDFIWHNGYVGVILQINQHPFYVKVYFYIVKKIEIYTDPNYKFDNFLSFAEEVKIRK